MLPESMKNVPAMAFRSVDFPDPLVPMTTTHDPSSIKTSTPRSERTSFRVPGLKVLEMRRISSMDGACLFLLLHPFESTRQNQRQENEYCCNELQIIRVQTPT